MKLIKYLLFFGSCFYASLSLAHNHDEPLNLNIGIKKTPPFVMQSEHDPDLWQGISMELWRSIAKENGWSYTLHNYDLQTLLDKTAQGEIDLAIGALTITSEREDIMDFTHSYFTTGLGIAVPKQHKEAPWLRVMKQFFSPQFLTVIAILLLLLLAIGSLVWLFERRHNAKQFPPAPLQGMGAGVWWSAVTMTTVGYGDKAPVSFIGRLLGLFWMFASLILVSSFTAAITSSLTIKHLERPMQSFSSISDTRIGTVTDSSSMEFLSKHGLRFANYVDLDTVLKALNEGEVEAVIYDAALLRYKIYTQYNNSLEILPDLLMPQHYAFALPTDSPLRESTNRALLQIQTQAEWTEVIYRYLGKNANTL